MPTTVEEGSAIEALFCSSELELPEEYIFDNDYSAEAEKELLTYFAMQEPQQTLAPAATLADSQFAGLWMSDAGGEQPVVSNEEPVSSFGYSFNSNNKKRRRVDSGATNDSFVYQADCFPPKFCNGPSATELLVQTMASNSSENNGYFMLVNSEHNNTVILESQDLWSPTPLCEHTIIRPMALQHVDQHTARIGPMSSDQFHQPDSTHAMLTVTELEPIPVHCAPLAFNLAPSSGDTRAKIRSSFGQQQQQQQQQPQQRTMGARSMPAVGNGAAPVVNLTDDILPVLSGYNFFFRSDSVQSMGVTLNLIETFRSSTGRNSASIARKNF